MKKIIIDKIEQSIIIGDPKEYMLAISKNVYLFSAKPPNFVHRLFQKVAFGFELYRVEK